MKVRENLFERGYYCAVATLLRMEGCVNTQIRELFSSGGDPSKADACDIELFVEHGLMSTPTAAHAATKQDSHEK